MSRNHNRVRRNRKNKGDPFRTTQILAWDRTTGNKKPKVIFPGYPLHIYEMGAESAHRLSDNSPADCA